MVIALPLTENETFSAHFGYASRAALFEVDPVRREISCSGVFTPPGLAPCDWAPWLRDLGVNRILASSIGAGAQARLAASGIEIVSGLEEASLEMLVQAWADGKLAVGGPCPGGKPPGRPPG